MIKKAAEITVPSSATVETLRPPGDSAPSPTMEAAQTSKKRRGQALKLIRRIHLYSGLLFLPWVLLYGFTGFLFNHPGAMSTREVRDISPETLTAAGFSNPQDPDGLADEVIAALKKHLEEEMDTSDTPPRFGEPRDARLRGSLSYSFEDRIGGDSRERKRHTVRLDWRKPAAKVYSSPASPKKEESPYSVEEDLELKSDPFDKRGRKIAAALAPWINAEKGKLRRAPILEMSVPIDEELWDLEYDFREGSLEANRASREEGIATRSFLTRLHVTHGYPPEGGAAWIWAIVVDLMALSMCSWGITGIVMWWNMKKLRMIGAVFLGISAAAAFLMGSGMFERLS